MLVSNVSFSLKVLTDRIKEQIGVEDIVYDEDLNYETIIRHIRSNRQKLQINKPDLPILVFNRENLRLDEDSIARRGSGFTFRKEGLKAELSRYCIGGYRVNFIYLTNNMLDYENKEVMLLSTREIFDSFEVDVDSLLNIQPDTFGKFKYKTVWDFSDLSKQFVLENTYYKTLQWSFTIKGVFCIFNVTTSPLIKTIDLWLKDFWKISGVEFKIEA